MPMVSDRRVYDKLEPGLAASPSVDQTAKPLPVTVALFVPLLAVAVPISGEQYRLLYYRCQVLATAEPPIGFDKMGMYLAPVLPARVLRQRKDETHGTFCSKIIVRALQEARIAEPELAGLEACSVTPSMLYVRLSKYFVPTQRLGTQL